MYKKKFRQWRFQTNRGGWDVRSTCLKRRTFDAGSDQLFRHPGLPAALQVQVAALRVIWDDAFSRLKSHLPPNYSPVTTAGSPRRDMCTFSTPEYLMIFQRSFGTGLEMMTEKGKASTCGAFYEQAFEQIEPIVRTQYVSSTIYLIDSLMETYFYNQPAVRRLLLVQLRNMASKVGVGGPRNNIALWTGYLLQMPDAALPDALERLTRAFTASLCAVLGPLHYNSLATRIRLMKIRSECITNTTELIKEWEQLSIDAQVSPDTCESLVYNVSYGYCNLLHTVMGDHARAVSHLAPYPTRLKIAKKDELPFPAMWTLHTCCSMYAKALAALGRTAEADATFRLVIAKCSELMGSDCPLMLHLKREYVGFLEPRGRKEETERYYAEIDERLRDFMLEDKGVDSVIERTMTSTDADVDFETEMNLDLGSDYD